MLLSLLWQIDLYSGTVYINAAVDQRHDTSESGNRLRQFTYVEMMGNNVTSADSIWMEASPSYCCIPHCPPAGLVSQ